jgi:hypothetical protein
MAIIVLFSSDIQKGEPVRFSQPFVISMVPVDGT